MESSLFIFVKATNSGRHIEKKYTFATFIAEKEFAYKSLKYILIWK